MFTQLSHWDKLVRDYGTSEKPAGIRLTRQTVKVGAVRWRWTMTLVIAPKGLYLHPENLWLFGKYAPVFIPWSQFKAPRPGHIYLGWQAVELSVGNPEVSTVTFPLNLYRQMTGLKR